MPSRRSRLRVLVIVLVSIIGLAGILSLIGPRTPIDTRVTFDAGSIGADPQAYLEAAEAAFPDIREGNGKQIVWADPESRQPTPLAIVYVHGFSASPGEVRPLPDRVAEALGANLFFTRLAGHGRSGDAMAEATVNAWVNDLAEAIAIGRQIGERVVLMGTSTGATLITWGATQPVLMQDVAALVQISPNYQVKAAGSQILTMPWGRELANLIIGGSRGFTPRNALHGQYWTTDYPTDALMPMAALVQLANDADIHNIPVPSLFVFSPLDEVVEASATEAIIARWGAATEVELVEESGDPLNHVLAGDALSPETTEAISARIVGYLRTVAGSDGVAADALPTGLASVETR
jgi:alpha-beta hydrolase superfamily lysophospholipase